jgi:hypothetical protein
MNLHSSLANHTRSALAANGGLVGAPLPRHVSRQTNETVDAPFRDLLGRARRIYLVAFWRRWRLTAPSAWSSLTAAVIAAGQPEAVETLRTEALIRNQSQPA